MADVLDTYVLLDSNTGVRVVCTRERVANWGVIGQPVKRSESVERFVLKSIGLADNPEGEYDLSNSPIAGMIMKAINRVESIRNPISLPLDHRYQDGYRWRQFSGKNDTDALSGGPSRVWRSFGQSLEDRGILYPYHPTNPGTSRAILDALPQTPWAQHTISGFLHERNVVSKPMSVRGDKLHVNHNAATNEITVTYKNLAIAPVYAEDGASKKVFEFNEIFDMNGADPSNAFDLTAFTAEVNAGPMGGSATEQEVLDQVLIPTWRLVCRPMTGEDGLTYIDYKNTDVFYEAPSVPDFLGYEEVGVVTDVGTFVVPTPPSLQNPGADIAKGFVTLSIKIRLRSDGKLEIIPGSMVTSEEDGAPVYQWNGVGTDIVNPDQTGEVTNPTVRIFGFRAPHIRVKTSAPDDSLIIHPRGTVMMKDPGVYTWTTEEDIRSDPAVSYPGNYKHQCIAYWNQTINERKDALMIMTEDNKFVVKHFCAISDRRTKADLDYGPTFVNEAGDCHNEGISLYSRVYPKISKDDVRGFGTRSIPFGGVLGDPYYQLSDLSDPNKAFLNFSVAEDPSNESTYEGHTFPFVVDIFRAKEWWDIAKRYRDNMNDIGALPKRISDLDPDEQSGIDESPMFFIVSAMTSNSDAINLTDTVRLTASGTKFHAYGDLWATTTSMSYYMSGLPSADRSHVVFMHHCGSMGHAANPFPYGHLGNPDVEFSHEWASYPAGPHGTDSFGVPRSHSRANLEEYEDELRALYPTIALCCNRDTGRYAFSWRYGLGNTGYEDNAFGPEIGKRAMYFSTSNIVTLSQITTPMFLDNVSIPWRGKDKTIGYYAAWSDYGMPSRRAVLTGHSSCWESSNAYNRIINGTSTDGAGSVPVGLSLVEQQKDFAFKYNKPLYTGDASKGVGCVAPLMHALALTNAEIWITYLLHPGDIIQIKRPYDLYASGADAIDINLVAGINFDIPDAPAWTPGTPGVYADLLAAAVLQQAENIILAIEAVLGSDDYIIYSPDNDQSLIVDGRVRIIISSVDEDSARAKRAHGTSVIVKSQDPNYMFLAYDPDGDESNNSDPVSLVFNAEPGVVVDLWSSNMNAGVAGKSEVISIWSPWDQDLDYINFEAGVDFVTNSSIETTAQNIVSALNSNFTVSTLVNVSYAMVPRLTNSVYVNIAEIYIDAKDLDTPGLGTRVKLDTLSVQRQTAQIGPVVATTPVRGFHNKSMRVTKGGATCKFGYLADHSDHPVCISSNARLMAVVRSYDQIQYAAYNDETYGDAANKFRFSTERANEGLVYHRHVETGTETEGWRYGDARLESINFTRYHVWNWEDGQNPTGVSYNIASLWKSIEFWPIVHGGRAHNLASGTNIYERAADNWATRGMPTADPMSDTISLDSSIAEWNMDNIYRSFYLNSPTAVVTTLNDNNIGVAQLGYRYSVVSEGPPGTDAIIPMVVDSNSFNRDIIRIRMSNKDQFIHGDLIVYDGGKYISNASPNTKLYLLYRGGHGFGAASMRTDHGVPSIILSGSKAARLNDSVFVFSNYTSVSQECSPVLNMSEVITSDAALKTWQVAELDTMGSVLATSSLPSGTTSYNFGGTVSVPASSHRVYKFTTEETSIAGNLMKNFMTTLDAPSAKSVERLYHGKNGASYAFGDLEGADTFDDYLENYLRPYIEHLVLVDGVDILVIPQSWAAWEGNPTTYKYRLSKILAVCRDVGVSVIPRIWSNRTNLSGTFYPLMSMAKATRYGNTREACIDRNLIKWTHGLNGYSHDYAFDNLGYVNWTGSYVTISSYAAYNGQYAGQLAPQTAALDNRVGAYASLSSQDLLHIELPPGVPAQFSSFVKYEADSAVTFSYTVQTTGASNQKKYWDGGKWIDTYSYLTRTASNTWMYEQAWFETYESSLDNLYSVHITMLASTVGTLSIDNASLILVGSEPDVRNYFNSRNTTSTYTFLTADEMMESDTGWKGTGVVSDEIRAPFDATRTPVHLPNPGTYRIRNFNEFLESEYSSTNNNLDYSGGYAYIDDVVETVKAAKDLGLTVYAYEVFDRPFGYNRPLYSREELYAFSRFIEKSIERVKASADYDNEDIMLSAESSEVFDVTGIVHQQLSEAYNEPLLTIRHRNRSGSYYYGMDTGSSMGDYVFLPDPTGGNQKIFATDFDASQYQVINYTDLDNKAYQYSSKMWDYQIGKELPRSPFSLATDIISLWVDRCLDSVSMVGIGASWNPDKFSNSSFPYTQIKNDIYSDVRWASSTVSLMDVGSVYRNDYFSNNAWTFSGTWLQTVLLGSFDDTNIGFPRPLDGHLNFDSSRKYAAYNNDGSDEYKKFTGYKLATDTSRNIPRRAVLPLQFNENWSMIYGGTAATSNFSGTNFVSRKVIDSRGNDIEIGWAAGSITATLNRTIASKVDMDVYSYEGLDGTLGRLEEDVFFDVAFSGGQTRIFRSTPASALNNQITGSWDHMWAMLPDFWTRDFEDLDAISAMWGAVSDVAANMLGHLYQYDMSKSILTAPHKIISSNDIIRIDDSTYSTDSSWVFEDGTSASVDKFSIAENILEIPVLADATNYDDATKLRNIANYEVESGVLAFKPATDTTSSDILFAPWISYDESIIYNNFGSYLDYQKPESEQYKNAVMAGIYGLFGGHTLNTFKLMCDALSGVPVIPYKGTVKFANLTTNDFVVVVEDMFGNERNIKLPANLAPSTSVPLIVRTAINAQVTVSDIRDLVGIDVFSLAPISSAFDIYDRVTDPTRTEIVANAIRSKGLGIYNHVIGEIDADSIGKLGTLYESLGWGPRENLFDDVIKMINRVRGQYHTIMFLLTHKPSEYVSIREPSLRVSATIDVEPTLDNNMVTWMGTTFSGHKVSTSFAMSQDSFERNEFDMMEGRSYGQVHTSNPITGAIATSSVYASFGGGLNDKADYGLSVGFTKERSITSKIFKMFPWFFREQQTSSFGAQYHLRDERGSVNRGVRATLSDSFEFEYFKQLNPESANEWFYELNRNSSSPKHFFDYSHSEREVNEVQIRSAVDRATAWSDSLTYSPSTGLTVAARIRPRDAGVIAELSGKLNYHSGGGGAPPPDLGSCCVPGPDSCADEGGTYYRTCDCVDQIERSACESIPGAIFNADTLCSSDPCPAQADYCCDDQCVNSTAAYVNCSCTSLTGPHADCPANCGGTQIFCCIEDQCVEIIAGGAYTSAGECTGAGGTIVTQCDDCNTGMGGAGGGAGSST